MELWNTRATKRGTRCMKACTVFMSPWLARSNSSWQTMLLTPLVAPISPSLHLCTSVWWQICWVRVPISTGLLEIVTFFRLSQHAMQGTFMIGQQKHSKPGCPLFLRPKLRMVFRSAALRWDTAQNAHVSQASSKTLGRMNATGRTQGTNQDVGLGCAYLIPAYGHGSSPDVAMRPTSKKWRSRLRSFGGTGWNRFRFGCTTSCSWRESLWEMKTAQGNSVSIARHFRIADGQV